MSKHLQRDIELIHRHLIKLSGIVESMIDNAAKALIEAKVELTQEVLTADEQVDDMEVEIEEECLKILALHQPFAGDMRRITTVLKINSELERMADLACNISQRAKSMHKFPAFPIPEKMPVMLRKATRMIRFALDSFVDSDSVLAKKVILLDEEVDQLNVEIIGDLKGLMQQNPNLIEPSLHCFSASRHIERVADLAENIAEDVIYLVDGDIVRHRRDSINETEVPEDA